MAGRPTKPLALVQGHRTKAEIAVREDAEKSLLTGVPMKMSPEVKNSQDAAKEFRRIKNLFRSIGKDDDLYSRVINTHCLVVSECSELAKTKLQIDQAIEELYEKKSEIEFLEYIDKFQKLTSTSISVDRQIQSKRKMILDISKENIMTVQSALRSIPKKPEEKKPTGFAGFMERRANGGG